jgi:hypothetical protein
MTLLIKDNRIQFGGFGSPFSHDVSSCMGYRPSNFDWIFNNVPKSGICVFMDHDVLGGFNSSAKYKYLWLCESKVIVPRAHELVMAQLDLMASVYRRIFTHELSLLQVSPIFQYIPPAANYTWIKDFSHIEKRRLATMVSSGKNYTQGHQVRNLMMADVREKFPWVEIYGRNFRPFSKKEDVLKDVMFSVTVENTVYECYYTEKLMDCFASRTIPLYMGAREVDKWFDPNGIIRIDESTFPDVLSEISREMYNNLSEAIEHNFNVAILHERADDALYRAVITDVG